MKMFSVASLVTQRVEGDVCYVFTYICTVYR